MLGVFFVANRYWFNAFIRRGEESLIPRGHIYFSFLNDQYRLMNIMSLVAALVVVGLNVIFGLYFSNKIAGPIKRVEKYLKNWAPNDDGKQLTIRGKDYFPELVDGINRALSQKKK